jgi:hypothetical protein
VNRCFLNTITSAGAQTSRSFRIRADFMLVMRMRSFFSDLTFMKSPAFAVWTNLIPGINQVGAVSKSLGFPVQSGHAHPFQERLPKFYFHEEQVTSSRAKQGTFFIPTTLYQNQLKMARGKLKPLSSWAALNLLDFNLIRYDIGAFHDTKAIRANSVLPLFLRGCR